MALVLAVIRKARPTYIVVADNREVVVIFIAFIALAYADVTVMTFGSSGQLDDKAQKRQRD